LAESDTLKSTRDPQQSQEEYDKGKEKPVECLEETNILINTENFCTFTI